MVHVIKHQLLTVETEVQSLARHCGIWVDKKAME
jgi:hypothetical protein